MNDTAIGLPLIEATSSGMAAVNYWTGDPDWILEEVRGLAVGVGEVASVAASARGV